MKKQKNYRLSLETLALLDALTEKYGVDQTSLITQAVRTLAEEKLNIEEMKEVIFKAYMKAGL